MRRIITIATFCALVGMAPAAAALPALPPGVNVQDILGGPISVPAGQTNTVDLGVPVSVSYNSGGWSVTSAGTAVSVTAPAEGGASVVVPVSAAGYTANLTLVAEDNPSGAVPPASAGNFDGGGASAGAPRAEKVTDDPARDGGSAATPVEHRGAEHIELESMIEGNRITVTLGVVEALKLFNQFRDVSRDGLSLRYLNAEGQAIEGVTRDIDEAARKLTLTYPAGETPDNPFILEVARGETTVAVVTLRDPRTPEAAGEGIVRAASVPADDAGARTGRWVLTGVLALAVVVGGVSLLIRRLRPSS